MNSSKVTTGTRQKQFLDAAKRGDLEYIMFLETLGVNINCRSGEYGKEDAVYIAIDNGHEDIAIHLIDNENYDLEFCTEYGRTHLMNASEKAMLKVMEKLYERGVDIYAQDRLGNLASMYACRSGVIEAIKFYVDKGHKDIFKYRNNNGETHLIVASQNKSKNGENPVASYILTINNENVFSKDCKGNNVFKYAFDEDAYVLMDELARYGIEKFGIHSPFINVESVGCAKVFIKYGFDVNDINNEHETVLFRIHNVNDELCKFFMSLDKVDVNKKNIEGDTAIIHLLSDKSNYWGRKLTKDLIEKRGADILIKGSKGKTALELVRKQDIQDGFIFTRSTFYRYLKKVEKQQKRKLKY